MFCTTKLSLSSKELLLYSKSKLEIPNFSSKFKNSCQKRLLLYIGEADETIFVNKSFFRQSYWLKMFLDYIYVGLSRTVKQGSKNEWKKESKN